MLVADGSAAAELSGALAFHGLRSEVVPPALVADHTAAHRWSAVLLIDGSDRGTLKTLDTWHECPPVIVVGLGHSLPERFKHLQARLLGRVERVPFGRRGWRRCSANW